MHPSLPKQTKLQIKKSTTPRTSGSPRKSHSITSRGPDDVTPHDLASHVLSTAMASPSGSGPSIIEDAGAAAQLRSCNRGRWSSQRYEAGQEALVKILREMEAVSGMTAVLRPVLREAARKVIGDTGLLDHLLKHMVRWIGWKRSVMWMLRCLCLGPFSSKVHYQMNGNRST